MARHTVALAFAAVMLAVGLVLVLLPQDYSGTASVMYYPPSSPMDDFKVTPGGGLMGFVNVSSISAPLSIGGASLNVQFSVASGETASAYLFPYYLAAEVWTSGAVGAQDTPLATPIVNQTSGTLSFSAASPGTTYGVIFTEEPSETANISLSWGGSIFFPYAELGIPLALAGAIVLIGVVASLPSRPEGEEYPASQMEMGAGYPAEPAPMIIAGPVTPTMTGGLPPAALPPATLSQYSLPPSVAPPAPTPAPALTTYAPPASSSSGVVRPGRTDPDTSPGITSPGVPGGSAWRPSPLRRPATVPTEAPGRTADLGADTGRKCPRCRLTVAEESWAFCPRCRMELP